MRKNQRVPSGVRSGRMETFAVRLWWTVVLATLATIFASLALWGQECSNFSVRGVGTSAPWSLVVASGDTLSNHQREDTALTAAIDSLAGRDSVDVLFKVRVRCMGRATQIGVIPPPSPPPPPPPTPTGSAILGAVVGIDSVFQVEGVSFNASTSLSSITNPRLVTFLVSGDPGAAVSVDGSVVGDSFPVFSLSDGPHVAGAPGAVPAAFDVSGIGDSGPPSPPGSISTSVENLRAVITAAGDTVGGADVVYGAGVVVGAIGYRWNGGIEGDGSSDWTDDTRVPTLTRLHLEGQWWACVRSFNSIAVSDHSCGSFVAPGPPQPVAVQPAPSSPTGDAFPVATLLPDRRLRVTRPDVAPTASLSARLFFSTVIPGEQVAGSDVGEVLLAPPMVLRSGAPVEPLQWWVCASPVSVGTKCSTWTSDGAGGLALVGYP